jgi:transcription elongation factor Elf1
MSSYIDIKYLNLISSQLQNFKKKNDILWNFRCPYCGDSKKNKSKARGFVYRRKNDLFFKCHNCQVGTTVGNLIKHIDSKTHKDYIMERYKSGVKSNNPEPEFKFDVPVFKKKSILKGLLSIFELAEDHPARKIVDKRKLPNESLKDIFLCESPKVVNTVS